MARSTNGIEQERMKRFSGKPEGKRQLGGKEDRWENNIVTILQRIW
jgi:hypothetical protein